MNMEVFLEQLIIYGGALALSLIVVVMYLRNQRKRSRITKAKIEEAKLHGLFEPVSLHPVIEQSACINCGSCVAACPEKDILGIVNGRATTINASNCVGHGACFHSCPVEAISLVIGTEKRGVDLPHVDQSFESNIPGIYIAGELGGMGLIKNAVAQGQQAVENIVRQGRKSEQADLDLVIVGAGPAGISAALTAKKHGLKFVTLEQETLGGTVFTFPRSKVVMTAPMNLSLHGKVKLFETSKVELLALWQDVLDIYGITIKESTKVESITEEDGCFEVASNRSEIFRTRNVLLAIGRRGSPRKLNIPGEQLEKVAYRLLEPENIQGKRIIVVGGGDSAIESALLLSDNNEVILSYRGDSFKRLKPKNQERVREAEENEILEVRFNTNLTEINPDSVEMSNSLLGITEVVGNDLVYIFAGGELPTKFLEKIGIKITRRFGHTLLKSKR